MTPKPGIPLSEPQTEAGRKLLDDIGFHAFLDGSHLDDRILAIEREARGIPLIDVELLARALMDFGYDVPADRSQRIAERYAEDAARLASESSIPEPGEYEIDAGDGRTYRFSGHADEAGLPVEEGDR